MYILLKADSRYVPSQWETALLYNDVSHWVGASLESALVLWYKSPSFERFLPERYECVTLYGFSSYRIFNEYDVSHLSIFSSNSVSMDINNLPNICKYMPIFLLVILTFIKKWMSCCQIQKIAIIFKWCHSEGREFIHKETLHVIDFSFIQSYLCWCNRLWVNTYFTYQGKLFTLLKTRVFALSLVLNWLYKV